jgi:predicted DsbA family dithiol-disulfide isomerase
MKVEIWSDFVCPFCYLGKVKFEKALQEFSNKENVEVVFKSFELDPSASNMAEGSLSEMIAKKYGITIKQAEENNERITAEAREVGLIYNLGTATPVNTLNTHRLFQYARLLGKGEETISALFKAYFTDSKNLSDIYTLTQISKAVGLEESAVQDILNSDKYTDEVRKDEKEAEVIGVTGVPFFLIDNKYSISGAQPVEVFKDALKKAWADNK